VARDTLPYAGGKGQDSGSDHRAVSAGIVVIEW
jgi:hypothetical protein